ncbi:MAG: recombinase family protein [Paenibacillaceae bacterium]|nr:recombinase family protein [Paenibacillaceae bacterium]
MKRAEESEKLLRVAVYIRVSSDEQAERGDSIRDQKERGIKYIEEHKNMVLQDIYLDDGVSGQKIDRDDFTRLMNHVKEGLVDLIIFTKLDRWFRSLRHYLNTQAVLEKYHAAWTAIDQPFFDTSTPYGRAFVAQSMTWAELEAQNGIFVWLMSFVQRSPTGKS